MIFPFVPPLGYASTFYRFKYFFSYLKKREPQIVADVPHRLSPGRTLPVLVIFRNGDFYPAQIDKIEVFIDGQSIFCQTPILRLNKSYQEIRLEVDRSRFSPGMHKVDIAIGYRSGKKSKRCINDNYRGTQKTPLPCYFSADTLPRIPGFYHGDCHSHSIYTDDQIEFGASLSASRDMATALGLDFFCVTDHSYDLDNDPTDFLKNDPSLRNWRRFRRETVILNQKPGCLIVPGEEVSVRNNRNENVHLLVLNEKEYLPGSGDSGEDWLHYHSELDIAEACKRTGRDAAIFAAHPADKAPALQRLLLNRGDWRPEDVPDAINGVQIFNGHGAGHLPEAVRFWRELLLKGHYLFALAGNDAHGSFGRNRYIRLPFFKIGESYAQLFGQWRTDICLSENPPTVIEIIRALKSGCYSLSNGPALELCLISRNGTVHPMGGKAQHPQTIRMRIRSTAEFGTLDSWTLYFGDTGSGIETILQEKKADMPQLFETAIEYPFSLKSGRGYIRARATTRSKDKQYFAYSNPIWIN